MARNAASNRIANVDQKSIIDLVEAMVSSWNDRDLDRFLNLLTDDVYWNDPAMPAPASGRESVRRFSESVLRAFPDFVYEIRGELCIAPDGSSCAVPWRISGTHLDLLEPPGFGPTNRSVVFEGVDLLSFRDSQVARIETYFDVIVPAQQLLGMSLRPAPGTLREWLVVRVQRLIAFACRLRSRMRGRP